MAVPSVQAYRLKHFRESVAESSAPALLRADIQEANPTDDDTNVCPTCDGKGQAANENGQCVTCGGTGNKKTREADPSPVRIPALRHMREATKKADGVYEVVVVEEGFGNPTDRNYYSKQALREAVTAGKFEGLRCYANHPSKSEERDRPERSIRDLIGNYRNGTYREVDGLGQAVAELHVIPGDDYDWARSLIESAIADTDAGIAPKAGISIDGSGVVQIREADDGPYFEVQSLDYLPSADVVTTPGAGGTFVRKLTESLQRLPTQAPNPSSEEDTMDPAQLQDKTKTLSVRLREAMTTLRAAKDDDAVAAAVTELDAVRTDLDAAAAETIEIPVREADKPAEPDAELQRKLRETETKLADVEKERDEAKTEASTLNRGMLAAKVLRESKATQSAQTSWFREVAQCADEDAMKALVQQKIDDETAQLRRFQESLGMDPGRVEGHPGLIPATAVSDTDNAKSGWDAAGIPIKTPEPDAAPAA